MNVTLRVDDRVADSIEGARRLGAVRPDAS